MYSAYGQFITNPHIIEHLENTTKSKSKSKSKVNKSSSDKNVEQSSSDKNVEQSLSDKNVEQSPSNKNVEQSSSNKNVKQSSSNNSITKSLKGGLNINGELNINTDGIDNNLRLGINDNYSWIQSYGLGPLHINPTGTKTCIENVCSQPSGGVILYNMYANPTSITPKIKLLENIQDDIIKETNIKYAFDATIYYNYSFNIALSNPIKNTTTIEDYQTFNITINKNTGFEFRYINHDFVINKPTIQNSGKNSTDLPDNYTINIPNKSYDSIRSIVKCSILFTVIAKPNITNYGFEINGLQKAIDNLGKLV